MVSGKHWYEKPVDILSTMKKLRILYLTAILGLVSLSTKAQDKIEWMKFEEAV